MKKELKEYISKVDKLIADHDITEELVNEHLIKIQFFQHERLIHLIVTLAYALFLFISIIISLVNQLFVFVTVILICFLIPYVLHYFFLENNVQYLYKQYDKMKYKK